MAPPSQGLEPPANPARFRLPALPIYISRGLRLRGQSFTLDSVTDSRLSFGGRVGRPDWVSDEEWALIGPLLPAERGRGCRPAQDNRRYFEGMMWMARTGAQSRHLPDEYDKWNSGTASSADPGDGSRRGCSMRCSKRARRDGGTRCHRRHDR
ncbi:transposase [Mesorhizobium australicum]|nr:transposase [Mesorhizobium sp. LNHC209A00]